jgi:hypothetical protein
MHRIMSILIIRGAQYSKSTTNTQTIAYEIAYEICVAGLKFHRDVDDDAIGSACLAPEIINSHHTAIPGFGNVHNGATVEVRLTRPRILVQLASNYTIRSSVPRGTNSNYTTISYSSDGPVFDGAPGEVRLAAMKTDDAAVALRSKGTRCGQVTNVCAMWRDLTRCTHSSPPNTHSRIDKA